MNNNAEFAETVAQQVAEKLAEGIRDGTFLPVSEYMTPAQAAAYLGLTEGGMETMRKEGRGPRYVRPSHKMVRYARRDLDAWCEQHAVQPGE
ncbi:Helix-turn-helix domain-containing protein [Lutimaribacter pacificus]|uniref:Helix-turn-helix domain-containing protein n=1 Tax=Lutimaribacter pacificus TaxID=391948 RepID=A0A1H0F7M3_9RHOB|nr:helix-turn-helix domain-containing protein [Lutimaribacter pacificus]SDN90561.1 Helix-turn-helix domain-containing protein [Lutimaribacter pacificus]SHK45826.1 Helix-turn-helix domain-containing protein [Lutimaribacter pacificus]